MKIALFADKEVGLQTLKFLESNYRDDLSVLVVIQENAISQFAIECDIPYLIYDERTHVNLESLNCDLGILAWWPKIIKENLIATTKQGFINFHPSYLPFNRGKHYNFWALVEQSPFGVTLHKVDKDIDSGDIVSQKSISYDWEDNGETLYNKAQEEIVRLFKSTYPIVRNGNFDLKPQDLANGSIHFASELDSASKINLDDKYTARELLNILRARTFKGHPSCWFEEVDGRKYEVRIQINKV